MKLRKKLRPEDITILVENLLSEDNARFVPWDDRYVTARCGCVFSRAAFGVSKQRYSKEWRELKKGIGNGQGRYLSVNLGAGNKWFSHRLTAAVYLGAVPRGFDVRHKDGNPLNGHISNLEYGTRKENMDDAKRHGTTAKGSRNGQSSLNDKTIIAIRNDFDQGMTRNQISQKYNISYGHARQIQNRTRWGWL